jgi:hypothetical protein
MATVAEFRGSGINVVPAELFGLDRATPSELAFLAMVRRHLAAARVGKMKGEVCFRANMLDGGITERWSEIKVKEK